MQTGQQGRAVGGIGLIEQHPRVKCLGLEHARGALRRGNVLRRAAGQPGIALRPVRSLCNRAAKPCQPEHGDDLPGLLRQDRLVGQVSLERQPAGAVSLHEHIVGKRTELGPALLRRAEFAVAARCSHDGGRAGRNGADARLQGRDLPHMRRGRDDDARGGKLVRQTADEGGLAAAAHDGSQAGTNFQRFGKYHNRTRLLVISLPLTIAHSARFVNSAALDAARAVWYTEAMDKKLRPVISIRIFRETKCFGPGVAELLRHVREAHSLRGAAMTMGMAYSKAWTIVKQAERELGFPLLVSVTGGRHGGGAELSPKAERLLAAYGDYCARMRAFAAEEFGRAFAEFTEEPQAESE